MQESTKKTLSIKWKAGYPAIYLLSSETPLVMADVKSIAKDMKRNCYSWTLGKGIVDEMNDKNESVQGTGRPEEVLEYLAAKLNNGSPKNVKKESIVILKEFHHFLDDPFIQALIKDLLMPFKLSQRMLVILSPVLKIPEELKKDLALVDTVLPGADELEKVINGICIGTELKGDDIPTGDLKKALIDSALGLTTTEAENAFSESLVRCFQEKKASKWDPVVVLNEKCQSLKKDGLLEYFPPGKFDLNAIGGMDELKKWTLLRKNGFSQAALDFGCEAPAGILLLGIPGTGKSLGAKCVAGAFGLPLLRCDMGKIFGSLVGESEANVRKIIQTAEAVSPCVLWLDEIEKGFAGSSGSGGSLDSGVGARVLGTFLTWMQEKEKSVFVYATANDVSMLPPELLRKGRFDEIFSVALPTPKEREEIFRIHLTKRKREKLIDTVINVKDFADATDGWSGAEIEAAIKDALKIAFSEGHDLNDTDLSVAVGSIVPLSVTMKSRIQQMTDWCKGRTRPASSIELPTQPVVGRKVGVSPNPNAN
jgi:ATPase family associated with various cellular activities (AAA)